MLSYSQQWAKQSNFHLAWSGRTNTCLAATGHTNPGIFFPHLEHTVFLCTVTEKIFTFGSRNRSSCSSACSNLITQIPGHKEAQALWAQLLLQTQLLLLQPLALPLRHTMQHLPANDLLFLGGKHSQHSCALLPQAPNCSRALGRNVFSPRLKNQLQVALCSSQRPTASLGSCSSACCCSLSWIGNRDCNRSDSGN